MKKNLISVLILAMVIANFVLTAILMFSVLPQTKKANALIDKVCAAIDLDLNSGASSALDNIPVDQREEYKVNGGESVYTNLAPSGDGKSHSVVLKVTLVLNKGSENYEKYTQEFLAGQDSTIQGKLVSMLGSYTVEQMREQSTKDEIQEIFLEEMQTMFGGDYVIAVNFSTVTTE